MEVLYLYLYLRILILKVLSCIRGKIENSILKCTFSSIVSPYDILAFSVSYTQDSITKMEALYNWFQIWFQIITNLNKCVKLS